MPTATKYRLNPRGYRFAIDPQDIGITEKQCTRCKILRSIGHFPRAGRNKGPRKDVCRHCIHIAYDESRTTEEYKAQVRARYEMGPKEWGRRKRLKIKAAVVTGYGGRCACCGEDTFEFLTIDHIYNDAKEDKRKYGVGGYVLYRKLIEQGFPRDRYQLLCWNCNAAKQFSKGCPHQAKKVGDNGRAQ